MSISTSRMHLVQSGAIQILYVVVVASVMLDWILCRADLNVSRTLPDKRALDSSTKPGSNNTDWGVCSIPSRLCQSITD